MPPTRRPVRRPADPSEASEPPQESTRIKPMGARRASTPPPDGEPAEEPRDPDETGEDGEASLPFSGDDEDENPDATRAGPPLSLEILEGPDKGRRKRFKSVRMVIGRGQDCELTLMDQSVSRRHVELVYGGESGVMLRDLVSGNGTKVNDERVDERKLNHDDVIAIGRTKLRFVDEVERIKQKRQAVEDAERKAKEDEERKAKAAEAPAAAPASAESAPAESSTGSQPKEGGTQIRDVRNIPRRAPAPRNPVGLIVAVALVLIFVLISGGVLFVKQSGPPPPPPPNPKQETARSTLQEARNAFRRGDYQEAVNKAVEADSVFPGVDTEGFLVAARTELAIVEGFNQVRGLMAANNFEEAKAVLEETPHGTAQSTEELRVTLASDLAAAEVVYQGKQVEAALDEGDTALARALIQKLPLERQPLYLAKVAELEAQLAQDATNAASQDRAARAAAARRAKAEREAFIANAFSAVGARFDAGDFPRATLECDRVIDAHSDDKEIRDRARLLKKLIPQFARFYQDGQRKMQSGALETAARSLRSAAEFYRQIGLKSAIGDTLDSQLAVSAVAAGKAALARGDVANAALYFGEAQRLRPDDPKAAAGLASLQTKLEEVFRRAYIQRDRDPEGSAEVFKLVSRLAPEGSDLKSRADAQLLGPQGDALPEP